MYLLAIVLKGMWTWGLLDEFLFMAKKVYLLKASALKGLFT